MNIENFPTHPYRVDPGKLRCDSRRSMTGICGAEHALMLKNAQSEVQIEQLTSHGK